MVPVQMLPLEQEGDDDGEDRQRDNLLNDFKLNEGKRPSVAGESYAVRRYCKAVFEKCDSPGKQDDEDQGPSRRDLHFLQFEMSVPSERHEHVRQYEHQYSPDSLHIRRFSEKSGAKVVN